MRRLFLAAVLTLLWPAMAVAQPVSTQPQFKVVTSCGSASYQAGLFNFPTVDMLGNQCSSSSGGTATVVGNVSNASSLATSSTNIGSISYNYGFDGTVWRQIQASLNGSVYQLDIDALAGSSLINTLNSATPAGTNLIGGTNLYDNGALNSLTNPAFVAQAEAADISGTFTNGTQTGNVTNSNADGYPTGLISIHGTYGTATATFLISDDGGTTTYPVACTRSDGSATETGYTALTNVSRQWTCPVGGNDTLEVLSSAVASGTVNVRVGISAGAQPPLVNTVAATPAASATGGASSFHAQSAASTNATLVSTAGVRTLYGITVINPTTSIACFHTYDNATSPTVGTTTIKHTYTAGAANSAGQSGGASVVFIAGEAYASGLTFSMTGGVSNTCTDADTSSAPLGVDIELSYK